MSPASRRGPQKRRSLEPIAWGALPVLALGVGVLASGVGIDLLVVAVALLAMFAVDRTVGDRVVERLGPGPGTAVFALMVAGCTWYFISFSSDQFFAGAEKRGYRTAYYQRTAGSDTVSPAASTPSDGTYVSSAVAPTIGARDESRSSGVLNSEPAKETRATADAPANRSREVTETRSAEQPSSQSVPREAAGVVSASKFLFGARSPSAELTSSRVTLTVSPAEIPPARRTTFQAVVSVEGRPLTEGVVDFTVNGTGIGRVALNSTGIATKTFSTHIAGSYEVRARFSGTSQHAPSLSDLRPLRVTPQ